MKKIIAILLSLLLSVSFIGGCSDKNEETEAEKETKKETKKEKVEKVEKVSMDEISICLASEPETLDPALNSSLDGATMIVHLFSGLAKWDADGVTIVPDCAESLPEGEINPDGTVTYTYTIRDDACWSDGVNVTAHDFEFAWKRAASTELWADYGYMFEVIKGYPDNLAVRATDERTLAVTLNNTISYWNELLAFPTYMPVREDVVRNEAWASDERTFVSNGPYMIEEWEHRHLIVLEKNGYYHDADEITMPRINCYLSDDISYIMSNYKNDTFQMIDMVPAEDIRMIKRTRPDEFKTVGQLGTYFICWNVNENILPETSALTGAEKERAQEAIRRALMLTLDRDYIVENLSQTGEVPASSFVPMGMTDYDGKEFYKNAGHSNEYTGYLNLETFEENYDQVVEILKEYYTYDESNGIFTDAPQFTYLFNFDTVHEAIATYVQSAFGSVGVTIELRNIEWNTFLEERNRGNFDVARHGWIADYNDPITFLDMWTSMSGNNDAQFGKGAHASLEAYSIDLRPFGKDVVVENGTWAETYDVLISVIKQETNQETRYKLMHYAEDLLMQTGCVAPLYYYTDLYMITEGLEGVYTNPLGYKYFMYSEYFAES